jgi:hypothetical protein
LLLPNNQRAVAAPWQASRPRKKILYSMRHESASRPKAHEFPWLFEISQTGRAAHFDFGLPWHIYYSHLQPCLLTYIGVEKRCYSTMGGQDVPE